MRGTTLVALGLAACLPAAVAQVERQHGIHQHGTGQIEIAVDGHRLRIEMTLAAMDVVGFEHTATNDAQAQRVREAAQQLGEGAALFHPDPAANCAWLTGEVDSELLRAQDHSHDPGHSDEAPHAQDHDHGRPRDNERRHTAAHADFTVSHSFRCSNPERLARIDINIMQHFPSTRSLQVLYVTPGRQGAAEIHPGHTRVDLTP